ncbi:MAG TPA: aromatic ring-hydroxylating dioxygenase subunit alpha [Caldimonas sp.]|jgi:phenylpropionate dioxygenase-like ring-hydroxylating dioxygenase large terminal subunit|nr:aromatic ring-hydroxylating dioxygenase subunit alpha [Caldimonas sp.]HEX2540003.1 aromatic ring-hydroxylating dioxygenase subunit alpha [Caldimonas sp.]
MTGPDEARILWARSERTVAHTELQRGAPSISPVGRYLDPDRHRREVAALRRLPHAVGPASRLASPGDWMTAELLDVPVLVVRGEDDVVRAFVNVCRHRGALVAASPACGSGRGRFVCPYHSWTYDSRGALVGRPHEADFPHVPRASASLAALPVALRCGLVWVVPEAVQAFDWNDYFGPMAATLEGLGYDGRSVSPHERRFVQPSNWKLVLDANLESYHFQYAHRDTIAHLFHDNLVQQESFGRHQRIVLPKRSLAAAAGDPGWELLGRHSNIIHFFFPGTFLLWEGDHVNGFCVTPKTAASCDAASWMLVPAAGHARRAPGHWSRNWSIFWDAIDEDFALAASMQKGLASGANAALNFGTAEFACDLFERAIDELVAGD